MAKGLCYKRRKAIGDKPDGPVPAGVNWDMFLGPAPMRAFNEHRFKYNWHWFWDTGNGDIGNQGVHEMDTARWGWRRTCRSPYHPRAASTRMTTIRKPRIRNSPASTTAEGNRLRSARASDRQRGRDCSLRRGHIGDLFYGTDGWMAIQEDGFQVFKGEKNEKIMDKRISGESGRWDTGRHMTNFLDAVKGERSDEAHGTGGSRRHIATLCHLANISYRQHRRLDFNAKNWKSCTMRKLTEC